jgi:hypothetical protein
MRDRDKVLRRLKELQPNQKSNIVILGIGLLIMIFAGCVPTDKLGAAAQVVNAGIGLAIVLPAILNLLQNSIEYRNWREANLLYHTFFDILMNDQLSAMRNIRYNQVINLEIKPGNISDEIVITCEHVYTYKNSSTFNKRINIDIFNDIFIPQDANAGNPFDKTVFERVKYNQNEIFTPQDSEKKFCNLPDGRPHFRDTITLEAGKDIDITYSINNVFQKFSRLIWNVQELSEGVKLNIKNTLPPDNISKFTLAINHPNGIKMQNQNRKFLDKNCHLKKGTVVGAVYDCCIEFKCPFLPYQGFELKWDLLAKNSNDGDTL